jgi:hypothetical protein
MKTANKKMFKRSIASPSENVNQSRFSDLRADSYDFASQFPSAYEVFVPIYRCGAVLDLHQIPFLWQLDMIVMKKEIFVKRNAKGLL